MSQPKRIPNPKHHLKNLAELRALVDKAKTGMHGDIKLFRVHATSGYSRSRIRGFILNQECAKISVTYGSKYLVGHNPIVNGATTLFGLDRVFNKDGSLTGKCHLFENYWHAWAFSKQMDKLQ